MSWKDRMPFINSLSGDTQGISTGSVYNFCRSFADACADMRPALEKAILNSREVCTDATVVTTNGVQAYIRNFSTKDHVLYCSCAKKNLETLSRIKVLKEYAGTIVYMPNVQEYIVSVFSEWRFHRNIHLANRPLSIIH